MEEGINMQHAILYENDVPTYDCEKCGMSYASRRALHEHQTKADHRRGYAMTWVNVAFVITIILALKYVTSGDLFGKKEAAPEPAPIFPRYGM